MWVQQSTSAVHQAFLAALTEVVAPLNSPLIPISPALVMAEQVPWFKASAEAVVQLGSLVVLQRLGASVNLTAVLAISRSRSTTPLGLEVVMLLA